MRIPSIRGTSFGRAAALVADAVSLPRRSGAVGSRPGYYVAMRRRRPSVTGVLVTLTAIAVVVAFLVGVAFMTVGDGR
jgi:hypothetical protein